MKPQSLPWLLAFIAIFTSCATSPPLRPAQSWIGLLPENSSLYISISDADKVLTLLEEMLPLLKLDVPDVQSILKDTRQIYGAVTFRENQSPIFSLALLGRYSSCGIGFGLSVSGQWIRDKKTNTYWQQVETRLKIAQPESYLLLITNDDMELFLFRRRNPLPLEISTAAAGFIEQNPAALFFPRFGEETIPENIPVNKIRLPIKEAILGINRSGNGYSVASSFDLTDDAGARLFSVTLKIFVIWMMRNAGINSYTSRVAVETDNQFVHGLLSDFSKEELVQIITAILDTGK